MSSALHFTIDSLISWPPAPDVDGQTSHPPLEPVPAMQRRRMSPLCKAAMHGAFGLGDGGDDIPLVFASRFGDMSRSIELLQQLSQGESLSPTQFSLSVHNAIGALHGILSGHAGQYTAIAAAEETVEAACCEALAMLVDGAPAVRLVVYDAPLPAPYQDAAPAQPPLIAWACRLRLADSGPRFSLESAPASGDADSQGLWPFLNSAARQHTHHCGQRDWHWARHG
ncbi:beta-ketoacyl synthase chain length factor [Chromobacterium subtsugae]|uniref:Beta-ketoacyl synthase chain length factor n=1 Tax=Chromobacterium subtsugae TaxID=251747 RepID=A0ABS7FCU0_9NEIS|nr:MULTISPECIES: beta-ketoacyl synthase chain length factor [Chromobacterium]MBW8287900.1 beta-ketoacyl synthase chain length factor [Chromobacterium subtsugae]